MRLLDENGDPVRPEDVLTREEAAEVRRRPRRRPTPRNAGAPVTPRATWEPTEADRAAGWIE